MGDLSEISVFEWKYQHDCHKFCIRYFSLSVKKHRFHIKYINTYQSNNRIYGAVEAVAESSHTLVRVGVEVAQDVVLQRRLHLRQVVAHPSRKKSIFRDVLIIIYYFHNLPP